MPAPGTPGLDRGTLISSVWERFTTTIGGIARLFDSPTVSVYWLYLASAAVVASLVYLAHARSRASATGLLRFLFNPKVWCNRSVIHDLGLFVVNTAIHSFLFAAVLQTLSSSIASKVWASLHAWVGPVSEPLQGTPAIVVATVALFAMADLAFFVAHFAMHRIPVLWAFHKVHHSAPVLIPLTVFRRHPVDILFEGAVSGVLLGFSYGLLGWMAGKVPSAHEILGVNVLLFACLLIGFNLQHSHVWMTYGPLDAVLISPAAHQIHHSDDPAHFDRNFGNMLSVWDRLVGTYVSPHAVSARPRFGLGTAQPPFASFLALYLVPLWDAVRLVGNVFTRNGRGGRGTTPS